MKRKRKIVQALRSFALRVFEDSEPAHPATPSSFDDMDDSKKIKECRNELEAGHKQFLPLLNALTLAQELILPEFQVADERAKTCREEYQNISEAAVWSGLFAIFLGLIEIILPKLPWTFPESLLEVLTVLEGIAAVACLVFIVRGTIRKPKNNWLLARYRAENLRLLKFKTMMNSRFWCHELEATGRYGEKPPNHVRVTVSAEVGAFAGLVYEDVRERAAQGVIPDVSEVHCPESCHDALNEIIDYYCEKRLTKQMNYLAAKSEEEEEKGTVLRLLTTILFFVSFGLVILHVFLDSTEYVQGAKTSPPLGSILVLGAVLLPALVAGIRTYRASREFERNSLRHRATHHSLQGLNVQMGEARTLAKKFRIARSCELILEFDSFEFMRLLREVEWYG